MIDLRSDTVTCPSEQMLRTIQDATFKDVFFDIDPSTKALEDRCAEIFGFEDALFTVSGTMSNQVAIKTHTVPGDDVLIDQSYHINYYEAAATSIISNVHLQTVHTSNGVITSNILEEVLTNRNKSMYGSKIKLVCLENSINYHSGKIFSFDQLERTSIYAHSWGWKVHLDGARVFNALTKERIAPSFYGKIIDSMMISLNKGLGAPFGAVLLGSEKFIKRARVYNKWFGGGLHQSGLLAELGLYAINNNIARIENDNNNATLLASLINDAKIPSIQIPNVDTNIVMLDLSQLKIPAIRLINILAQNGVMLYEWSEYVARAVTNLSVSEQDIKYSAREIVSTMEMLVGKTYTTRGKM